MALAAGLGAVGAAHAESPTPEPTPTVCEALCTPGTAGPGEEQGKPDPKPTQEPSVPAQPADPAPAPPAKKAPAAPEPEPTLAPEPSATVEETPTAEATTASPSPTPSTAGPSTESNWNKPITKSARPTQAAAISGNDGTGPGTDLLPIVAGVLLVGIGGISFAWWSRNRISAH